MRGAWADLTSRRISLELKSKFTEIIQVDKQPFIEAVMPAGRRRRRQAPERREDDRFRSSNPSKRF
jgi:hypothetical protein